MTRNAFLVAAACLCALPVLAQPAPSGETNPFFQQWNTPFGAPPFDRIQTGHYLPAFERGIAEERREVEAIAQNPAPPTFQNTFEALDGVGLLLDKVDGVFSNLTSSDTSDQLVEIDKKVAPLLSSLRDDRVLNQQLFARVKSVWERRASLGLSPVQLRLVEETYKGFVRGGANLGAPQQARLRAINQELSLLSIRFGDNMLKETNAYRLTISRKVDLAGLPPGVVEAAAGAAAKAGQSGKWVFTLHAPSIWPFLSYSENRELRRQIFTAYISRGSRGNEFDNREIAARTAVLRAERAALLGYASHADYVLAENMAKTPAAVYALLNRLWTPATAVARREAADMQALVKQEGGDFKLEPWDWWYYSAKVKQARYALDENQLRPYLSLDAVREGAFLIANKLYGLTFTERNDIPKYNPEVRAFEVKDAAGTHMGVFLADYHPRPSKGGGAWSNRFRGLRVVDGRQIRPIVVNVCNFTRPSGSQPALLSPEEAKTLFHEFGHAIHSLVSQVPYAGLSRSPRDFVELPSQFMANWALDPQVVKLYARHYQTGAAIPDELVAKLESASKFNQGFATVEYLAASFLDMDWHTIPASARPSTDAFEKASLEKIELMPEIVTRYRTPYFQHIFAGGYSAGYYSYIWSEVLDSDAFQAFREKGLFDPETARAFKHLLEQGGAADPMELYKAFRGREPSVDPLLVKRGLKN